MSRSRANRFTEAEPSAERWIVSYADFITLLFAFFTLLYAVAIQDRDAAQKWTESIGAAFADSVIELGHEPRAVVTEPLGAPASLSHEAAAFGRKQDRDLDLLGERARKLAIDDGRESGMRVRQTEEGLVISLAEQLHFDAGGASLEPGAQAALRRLAELLQSLPNHVRVEGHTDDVPAAGGSSNWSLSTSRAVQIVRALEATGVPRHRLSAAGYADQRPLVSNRTAAGRKLNRRVDVVVLRARLGGADN